MAKKPEKESTEVVNWAEKMAAEAKEVASTERQSVNRINFKSGVMTYMDQALPDNTLDCIIVASVWENVFYKTKWKAGVTTPPACFALGAPSSGTAIMQAHTSVPDSPGPICATCDMFKWESALEGGKGKACAERRRLAVIAVPKKVEDIAEAELATMSIPVTSVKNWANYINKLAAMIGRPSWGVITTVKLIPDSRTQFKVTFEPGATLAGDFLGPVNAKIPLAVSMLLTPYELEGKEEEQETESEKY